MPAPLVTAALSTAIEAAKTYGAHPKAKAPDKTDAASQDFEAVFLTQMMERMFHGLGGEGPLGSGAAGGAYRSLLADQYGKTIASAGGIGLADGVRRELIALQQGNKS